MAMKSRPPLSVPDRPPKTSRPTHWFGYLAALHPVSGIRLVRAEHRFSSPAHARGLMPGQAPRRSLGPSRPTQDYLDQELSEVFQTEQGPQCAGRALALLAQRKRKQRKP